VRLARQLQRRRVLHRQRLTRHAFVVSETGGTWGTAQEVAAALNKGGNAQVSSVSCPSAGNCGAGGQYRGRVKEQAFVIGES
jgi:hypothetical protein